jgi:hypothetical protein
MREMEAASELSIDIIELPRARLHWSARQLLAFL